LNLNIRNYEEWSNEIPLTFKCENQQIVGILHLPRERRKVPLVILMRGWSANKLGTWGAFFVKAAREFSKNGFAVLRFDFRGSGDSEGRFEDQTITSMLKDLDAVITQVSEKYPEVDNSKVSKICKRIKIPTLFIYGESDGLVLPSEGIKFYKKIKFQKRL